MDVWINAYPKCEPKNPNWSDWLLDTNYINSSLPSGVLRLPSQVPRLSVLHNVGTLRSQFLLHTVHKAQYNRWMKDVLRRGVLEN